MLWGLCLLLTGSAAWAQPYQYLLHIKDKDGVPDVRDANNDGILELTFSNAKLQQVYTQGKYDVTAFRRNFTAIDTGVVAKVYYIEVDDQTFPAQLEREQPNWYDYAAPPTITFESTQTGNDYLPNDFDILPPPVTPPSNLRMIRAPEAWHITKGDPDVVIGIVDGDLNETHEDIIQEIDYSVDNNPVAGDHGTGVAGVAAAETDNNRGISGVGFNCHLGFTSTHEGDGEFSMDVWDRMVDMADNGIRIINCSWSLYDQDDPDFDFYDPIVRSYLTTLHSKGVLVVFAAGNDPDVSGSLETYRYPGAYSGDFDNVMCVTSVGHRYAVGVGGNSWEDAAEETIGDPMSTHRRHDRVDICAPGFDVRTTGDSSAQQCAGPGCAKNDVYMNVSGTSMAAAHVSGAAGLLLSLTPSLTPAEIKNILKSTADASIYTITHNGTLVNGNYVGQLGTGRLDVFEAVKAAYKLYTTGVSATTVCWNGEIEVFFTSDVSLYDPPVPLGYTTVTAQLSDASGSFDNPVPIGSVTLTNPNVYQPLIATIPPNTPPGSGYRIRVVSSNPEMIGTTYDQPITVQQDAPGSSAATAIPITLSACGSPVTHQINTALGCYSNANFQYQDEAWYAVTIPTGFLTVTSCGLPNFQTAIQPTDQFGFNVGNCAVYSSSTIQQPGTYLITIEGTGQNGLIETTFSFTPPGPICRGTGGGQPAVPTQLDLFPNPARTYFALTEATDGAVRLFDLTGRLVRTYPAGTTSYDVRSLPAGSYLVEIDQDAGILRRRLQLTR